MKENKNIERLFQEKFKDFDPTPPKDAWANIEAQLNKKENKKRIIPFWFKSAGIAALLLLSVYFVIKNTTNITTVDNDENTSIVNSNNENVPANNENDNTVFDEDNFKGKIIKSNEVVTENENNLNFNNKSNNRFEQIVNANTKGQVQVENNLKGNKKSSVKSLKSKTANSELLFNEKNEAVVSADNVNSQLRTQRESVFNQTEKASNIVSNINSTIVSNDKNKKYANNEENASTSNLISNNLLNSENLVVNETVKENENSLKQHNNTLADNEIIGQDINVGNLVENNSKNNTKIASQIDSVMVNSVLAENQLEVKEDSTLVANLSQEENVLEQLLKEKEEGKNVDEKEKEKRNKWVVSSNAAPVYFNSMSNGSPLGEDFVENDKSYITSLSYGLGVQYDVTKKISIKTGVNSLDFSYKTNNVYYKSTFAGKNVSKMNLSGNLNSKGVQIFASKPFDLYGDVENYESEHKGEISQEINYVEVPLELSYSLINKRIGINIIGGISTLFLSKNSISLLSNNSYMELGKANNLNNIHFSSNVGLGFKYMFWKSFQANFQPMFKYQINTFSEDAGNFKPYFIGLYSGLSFSF